MKTLAIVLLSIVAVVLAAGFYCLKKAARLLKRHSIRRFDDC